MPLVHTLVKSFIYIYIYKVVISKRSKMVRRNKSVPKYSILIDKQTKTSLETVFITLRFCLLNNIAIVAII